MTRRRSALVAVAVAGALAVAAPAVGLVDLPGVHEDPDGPVLVEENELHLWYEGELRSPADLMALQRQGKAMVTLVGPDVSEVRAGYAFDTEAEMEAFVTERGWPGAPAP